MENQMSLGAEDQIEKHITDQNIDKEELWTTT